ETALGEARKAAATVELWSDPGHGFKAHLRELSPQADATTRTYAARFTIENPDDSVALGMTATVTLSDSSSAQVAKLPLSAILNRGSGPCVYLVDAAGALELRPVTVTAFNENVALVSAGVAEGDSVVTLGVQKLVAGTQVRTVETR
ncbi:MAG TPA: efflux RND transporter periplasmic adaptor subunit, partial [Thermoanaerobaculia bacterium]|nr:efflux RND transporter periplasmic adaptor subunit [Thermoanaerobaculia bacterium]